jgi:hypothetical protein
MKTTRIRTKLYEAIAELAKQERRSVQAQVDIILSDALGLEV